MNLSSEVTYRTARSGGKGGQNVNKVETMVEVLWSPSSSRTLSHSQVIRILEKLDSRINSEGILAVRCSQFRSQLENKQAALKKLEQLVIMALIEPKVRTATKPSLNAQNSRIQHKKRLSDKKANRRRFVNGDE